jgi:ketosteroid isomerase-like protein
MRTEQVVLSFVDAINAHDVERIIGLCAKDHCFVDAYGTVVSADRVQSAWAAYFRFMPLYGIEVETLLCKGDTAAVFGWAWGGLTADNLTGKSWRRPCAWRARTETNQIKLWQVYVDTKAVFDLL